MHRLESWLQQIRKSKWCKSAAALAYDEDNAVLASQFWRLQFSQAVLAGKQAVSFD